MSDEPMIIGGVVCTCLSIPDTQNLELNLDCPLHGTRTAWASVGGEIGEGLWETPNPPSEPSDRVWEPIREYKFEIVEPGNQDAMVLKFIKYEYMKSWNEPEGTGYVTKDGRSFVFNLDEDGEGFWHEYSGYDAFNLSAMPLATGWDIEVRKETLREQNEFWKKALFEINEREDFYKFQVTGERSPRMVVNAPTEQQIQEIIDDEGGQ